jgi:hypothetical protein
MRKKEFELIENSVTMNGVKYRLVYKYWPEKKKARVSADGGQTFHRDLGCAIQVAILDGLLQVI